MRSKVTVGEYLAFLSLKYEVDPDKFFYALISAWENQKALCGKISIRCREKKRDKAVFLITTSSKVVAQFSISRNFLSQKDNPIKNLGKTNMIRRYLVKKAKGRRSIHIRDLRAGMKQISLKAKVLEIPKPVIVFTRFGNYASVTNASITDGTGTIKLCLWNQQIASVSVGDTVHIENAYVSAFRGERQLRIGRNGKLNVVEGVEFSVTEEIKNV